MLGADLALKAPHCGHVTEGSAQQRDQQVCVFVANVLRIHESMSVMKKAEDLGKVHVKLPDGQELELPMLRVSCQFVTSAALLPLLIRL